METPELDFRTRFKPDYTGMQVQERPFCIMENYEGNPEEYKLDLITSENKADTALPVVFFIHGGGFVKPNDKRQPYISRFARVLTKAGYAVVSPDYPQFENEAHIMAAGGHDAGCAKSAEAVHYAYQYVVNHAAELQLDNSRIAIMGGSAGSMAAFYAIANYADAYHAFINCWGAPTHIPDLSKFPATLTIHGMDDPIVPFALETPVAAQLEQAGIPHRLIALPDCGHTPLNKFDDFMPVILEWFAKYL